MEAENVRISSVLYSCRRGLGSLGIAVVFVLAGWKAGLFSDYVHFKTPAGGRLIYPQWVGILSIQAEGKAPANPTSLDLGIIAKEVVERRQIDVPNLVLPETRLPWQVGLVPAPPPIPNKPATREVPAKGAPKIEGANKEQPAPLLLVSLQITAWWRSLLWGLVCFVVCRCSLGYGWPNWQKVNDTRQSLISFARSHWRGIASFAATVLVVWIAYTRDFFSDSVHFTTKEGARLTAPAWIEILAIDKEADAVPLPASADLGTIDGRPPDAPLSTRKTVVSPNYRQAFDLPWGVDLIAPDTSLQSGGPKPKEDASEGVKPPPLGGGEPDKKVNDGPASVVISLKITAWWRILIWGAVGLVVCRVLLGVDWLDYQKWALRRSRVASLSQSYRYGIGSICLASFLVWLGFLRGNYIDRVSFRTDQGTVLQVPWWITIEITDADSDPAFPVENLGYFSSATSMPDNDGNITLSEKSNVGQFPWGVRLTPPPASNDGNASQSTSEESSVGVLLRIVAWWRALIWWLVFSALAYVCLRNWPLLSTILAQRPRLVATVVFGASVFYLVWQLNQSSGLIDRLFTSPTVSAQSGSMFGAPRPISRHWPYIPLLDFAVASLASLLFLGLWKVIESLGRFLTADQSSGLGTVSHVSAVTDRESVKTVIAQLRARARWLRIVALLSLCLIFVAIGSGLFVFSRAEQTAQTVAPSWIQTALNSLSKMATEYEFTTQRAVEDEERVLSNYKRQLTPATPLDPKELSSLSTPLSQTLQTNASAAKTQTGEILQQLKQTSDQEAEVHKNSINYVISFISTKIGSVLMLVFLTQILVQLYRHNIRLASFCESRADVLQLHSKADDLDLKKLFELLNTDKLDFGKTPIPPTKQALDLLQKSIEHAAKAAADVGKKAVK